MQQFKNKVHEIIATVLKQLSLEKSWAWRGLKPVVGMAIDTLDEKMEDDPEEVHKWIGVLRDKAEEALAAYKK